MVVVTLLKVQNNSECEKIHTQEVNEQIYSVNCIIHNIASDANDPTTKIQIFYVGL